MDSGFKIQLNICQFPIETDNAYSITLSSVVCLLLKHKEWACLPSSQNTIDLKYSVQSLFQMPFKLHFSKKKKKPSNQNNEQYIKPFPKQPNLFLNLSVQWHNINLPQTMHGLCNLGTFHSNLFIHCINKKTWNHERRRNTNSLSAFVVFIP
jgi:hypothetical protein